MIQMKKKHKEGENFNHEKHEKDEKGRGGEGLDCDAGLLAAR